MSDHYNITMTVMVKRDPETAHTPPPAETFDGGKTLSKIIDKGFPYDDGDNSIEDQTPKWSKKKTETPINVGKLNGENVTKQALVALVKDTDKEDREKALKASWETEEPGRAELASLARQKYMEILMI